MAEPGCTRSWEKAEQLVAERLENTKSQVKDITSREKADLIAHFASEKKGEDIVLIDMSSTAAMFDWFVIISAKSSRQVSAVAKGVQRGLSKDRRINPLNVEGKQNPQWVLLDYEDVVVHVFHDEIREFYGLERLWSDAPSEHYDPKCTVKTPRKK
ncbi:MAG: ribosome silencing factor [Candidatus Omnitrophica bacterium]|nr:ribosome silencing factor [Candidatus Omnitrophota bacterium]